MSREVCEHWNELNNCEECKAMSMKESRFYEVVGDAVYIYDNGYKDKSKSVSVVNKSDLNYYRNNFNLRKVWSTNNES